MKNKLAVLFILIMVLTNSSFAQNSSSAMEFSLGSDKNSKQILKYFESLPGSNIQWRGNDWRVSYGFGQEVYLDIMFLEDYNSDSELLKEMEVINSYIQQNEKRVEILDLVKRRKTALTILVEPTITEWSDERISAIKQIAEDIGIFVWSEKGLYNINLKPIITSDEKLSQPFINEIDNAGIYASKEKVISLNLLSKIAPEAKVLEIDPDNQSSYSVEWTDVKIQINTKSAWEDRNVQLQGIKNWINKFPEQEKSSKRVVKFLGKVDTIVDLYGCIISPGYDKDDKAMKFITNLTKEVNGFIFSHQSFYDETGKKIIGSSEDSNSLSEQ